MRHTKTGNLKNTLMKRLKVFKNQITESNLKHHKHTYNIDK